MASISQTIPYYIQGISEQPDQLKKKGQVRDALNVLPDITDGLLKRPPAQFLNRLSDYNLSAQAVDMSKEGAWFSVDQTDKYIGRVNKDGSIAVWKNDGTKCAVSDLTAKGTCQCQGRYLAHTNPESIKFLTINDHTFVVNREKTVGMMDAERCEWESTDPKHSHYNNPNDQRAYEAFINITNIDHSQQYPLDIGKWNVASPTVTNTRVVKMKAEWLDGPGGSPRYMGVGGVGDRSKTYQDVFDINPTPLPTGSALYAGTTANQRNLRFKLMMTAMPYSHKEWGVDNSIYRLEWELYHGGYGWQVGDNFEVQMGVPVGPPGGEGTRAYYRITVVETEEWTSKADIGIIRPMPTAAIGDYTITVDRILEQLTEEINTKTSNYFNITKVGNGLHLSEASPPSGPSCRIGSPFSVTTTEHGVMNILTSETSDVTKLPSMCKDGYIVKIVNSPNADEDDHWMKFVGESGKDGKGHWEETYDPCVEIAFDPCVMPHKLVRTGALTFDFDILPWALRNTGDDTTNPKPSFVGSTINNIHFFRNRLCFLSQENVILSQAGDYYNFWSESAKEISDADVVDITASSTEPAVLADAVNINQGLLIFSSYEQFMLTTDTDRFTPDTAKLNSIAQYDYNTNVKPFVLGTSVGFTSNSGLKSRFWEMGGIGRDGAPTIIEQSAAIANSLPTNFLTAAVSTDNHIVLFTGFDPTVTSYGDCIDPYQNVWGYRYFSDGQQRIQSAWFRWKFFGEIIWHTIMDNSYYIIIYHNGGAHLCVIDLEKQTASNIISDTNTCVDHRVYLDNTTKMTGAYAGAYSAATGLTTWTLPPWHNRQPTTQTATSGGQQVIYATTGAKKGDTAVVPAFTANSVSSFSIVGDWSSSTVYLGYTYDMTVEFPHVYLDRRSEAQGTIQDTNSPLTVHRTKFTFGPTGYYSTVLQRKGRDDYVQFHESSENHSFNKNEYNIQLNSETTVPIYARNSDYRLKLRATHPTPCTLYGQTWEGDYNLKNYRRA